MIDLFCNLGGMETLYVVYKDENKRLGFVSGENIEQIIHLLYGNDVGLEDGKDFMRQDKFFVFSINKESKFYIGRYGNSKFELVEPRLGIMICNSSSKSEIIDICNKLGITYEDFS